MSTRCSFVIAFIFLASCTNAITPSFDEKLLLRTWYFDWQKTRLFSDSHKKLYVAEGQPLPPAWGRTGMIFDKNGKYTHIGIAPADGPLYLRGSWLRISPTMIAIQYEDRDYLGKPLSPIFDTLEVLSLSATELVVRSKR